MTLNRMRLLAVPLGVMLVIIGAVGMFRTRAPASDRPNCLTASSPCAPVAAISYSPFEESSTFKAPPEGTTPKINGAQAIDLYNAKGTSQTAELGLYLQMVGADPETSEPFYAKAGYVLVWRIVVKGACVRVMGGGIGSPDLPCQVGESVVDLDATTGVSIDGGFTESGP